MVGSTSAPVPKPAQSPPRPDRTVLLYDDGCRFCRAMTEVAARLAPERRLAILPWSHELAQTWMAPLSPAVRDASMHLKLRDGRLLSGPETFVELVGCFRGGGLVRRLAQAVPPADRALRAAYSLVAGRRGPLSRLVPDRPALVREPHLR